MRAVRFDRYGGSGVLEVRDVDDPVPTRGRVLARIRAAVDSGEIAIRDGALARQVPTDFPSGEGSDLAGVVEAIGDGVDDFVVVDAVCGCTDERASHAELAAVPVDRPKKHRDPASRPDAGKGEDRHVNLREAWRPDGGCARPLPSGPEAYLSRGSVLGADVLIASGRSNPKKRSGGASSRRILLFRGVAETRGEPVS